MSLITDILTDKDREKVKEFNKMFNATYEDISRFAAENNIDEFLLVGSLRFSDFSEEKELTNEAKLFLNEIKERQKEIDKKRNAFFTKKINAYFSQMSQEDIYEDARKYVDLISKEDMQEAIDYYNEKLPKLYNKTDIKTFPTTPGAYLIKSLCSDLEYHTPRLNEDYLNRLLAYIQDKVEKAFPNIEPFVSGVNKPVYTVKECFITKPKKEVATPISTAETYSMLNSKVSNQVIPLQKLTSEGPTGQMAFFFSDATEAIEKAGHNIVLNPHSKKEPVVVQVCLSYVGDLTYNKARITPYDENVLNTICSIMLAGNNKMTLTDIARTMNGNSKKRITDKQLENIKLAIIKLNGTRIYIDITQELNSKYFHTEDERLLKGVVDDNLLSYIGFEAITVAGKKTYQLIMKEWPILFSYSAAKDELVSFDTYLLDVPGHYTDDYTNIKFYLLKQIKLIKKHIRDNKNISFDTIYKETGKAMPAPNRRDRDRKVIYSFLDYWKDEGFINGYKIYKKGKDIKGITIDA